MWCTYRPRQVEVASVHLDCTVDLDVQAVGETLDRHVLQARVRYQERRFLAQAHLHHLVSAFVIIDVETQALGVSGIS